MFTTNFLVLYFPSIFMWQVIYKHLNYSHLHWLGIFIFTVDKEYKRKLFETGRLRKARDIKQKTSLNTSYTSHNSWGSFLSSPGPKPLVLKPKPKSYGPPTPPVQQTKKLRWTAGGRTWSSPASSARTSSILLNAPSSKYQGLTQKS